MNEHTTVTDDDDLWGLPPALPSAVESVDGEPPKPHRRRRWIAAAAGALAVGVGALVGATLASSSTQSLGTAGPGGGPGGFGGPGGRGGGNAGTIASISGSSLKMTTLDGKTVGVTTSESTTVTVLSTGALTDVKVGDNVRVNGTLSGTTIAAEAITDSGTSPLTDLPGGGFPGGNGAAPPTGVGRAQNGAGTANGTPPPNGAAPPDGGRGFRGGGGTTGVVKTFGSGTFTVTTSDGSTVTVTTTSATAVTLVKAAGFSTLKVGDEIQVTGTTGSDGTIAATTIRAGALPARN